MGRIPYCCHLRIPRPQQQVELGFVKELQSGFLHVFLNFLGEHEFLQAFGEVLIFKQGDLDFLQADLDFEKELESLLQDHGSTRLSVSFSRF